ncbi:hypothetical protein CTA2_5835 [Colletotrichum tanaceti]|uniref:Methyltransferase domain-containing protein n=1 Tax=Colletotrichum tanaceti TaxID=1306861 RepID=A0A4U6X0I8_9PEZI|nr:hypothetical protein CTA2_5835 [Colletotrichum tanaceti]TKW48878.1 hypothetical protein CTA1_9836 [Colletotrichum tanaceti]
MAANISLRPAEELVACLLELPDNPDRKHDVAALLHRQQLVRLWKIQPGSRVLEIGPGQGDLTVVLADAVGPQGLVVGVDPAPLDEGTPTYRSARAHVLASAVGGQIEFVPAYPVAYLTAAAARGAKFDFVVLGHCIWYFSHPTMLPDMLAQVRHMGTGAVLIAEYSLSTTHSNAFPHLLAALAVNALESFRDETSKRNIRCVMTPLQIITIAEQQGFVLVKEDVVVPAEAQRDGWREVLMALKGKSFARHVEEVDVDSKVKTMLLGMRDALAASVAVSGLDSIRNMDVWVARFETVDITAMY